MEKIENGVCYDTALEYFLERGLLVDFMLQKVLTNGELGIIMITEIKERRQ